MIDKLIAFLRKILHRLEDEDDDDDSGELCPINLCLYR